MVYCGKASQGCQSCRTRRIKCDKVRPQCTQCVRVAKVCPGYRDQLELMFRDESTKVIQKAHAQWGVSDSFDTGEPSGSSPTASSSPSSTSSRSRTSISGRSSSKASTPPGEDTLTWVTKPNEIYSTRSDQAIRFFIEHYLVGHPDEAKASRELQGVSWIHAPQIQHIMAAIGLTSMSNLTGNKELQIMAKEKYGLTLRSMVASVQNVHATDMNVAIRTVVMLALFEVVRGDSDPSTRTHLMGAAALLKAVLPRTGAPSSPAPILRALLQLCFSMLIPCLVASSNLPDVFFDWVTTCEKLASASDKPSTDLIRAVARLVHLQAFLRGHVLVDGGPKTSEVIREALEIEALLDAWVRRQGGIWFVTEECGEDKFPPEAVFEGCYHVYTDMWTARVWNHYRWSRIMVNEVLLQLIEGYPASSKPLISANQQSRSRNCMASVARDILVSIPTHYRHPTLSPAHRIYFDKTTGGAGMGAAGIPTLLFQIKVAGCAPSIPPAYRNWARRILETVWADTGITQARGFAELVSRTQERGSPVVTKLEFDEEEERKPQILGSPFIPYPQQQQQQQQELPQTYLGVQIPER